MSELDDWVATVAAATGLEEAAVDVRAVLDLARDVAHGVARPAAPLTAYMAGYLLGSRGATSAAEREAVFAQLRALIPG
ncbi:DUF6457 domain-containing protein [Spongisporangium articulatum]|uniref:DUF6457 domain-containing protein n=1 Tax=Spongisporangium articulatum TaxID=3362603 RepID=A0ABW8ASB5_9ACTN